VAAWRKMAARENAQENMAYRRWRKWRAWRIAKSAKESAIGWLGGGMAAKIRLAAATWRNRELSAAVAGYQRRRRLSWRRNRKCGGSFNDINENGVSHHNLAIIITLSSCVG